MDEKISNEQVEIQNKNCDDLYVAHPLTEETVQVRGEKQNEVSISELGDQVHESLEVHEEEEKHPNETYEASKNPERNILEHISTEGAVTTEKIETGCELNPEEEFKEINNLDNIKEVMEQTRKAANKEVLTGTKGEIVGSMVPTTEIKTLHRTKFASALKF